MSRFPMALLGLLMLSACQNAPVRDLVANPKLYQATGFRARNTMPLKVFVAPLTDRRGPLAAHSGMYPLVYTEDRYWDRPVGTMLDELLRREIEDSRIFASVVETRAEADWVLEPYLMDFHGAVEERIAGRAVRGRTALHLRVFGPQDTKGKRAVLREKRFEGPIDAHGMMFVPDPHALAASSFRKACGLMLIDLELGGRRLRGEASEAASFDPNREKDWGTTTSGR